MELFFIKLIVAVVVVVGLSLIAEHVSPKVAGILSGYPTGTAISLFFFGLEQDPNFAAASAIYSIIGLVAMLSFMWFYYLTSAYIKRFNLLFSSLLSILGYLAVAWCLQFIQLTQFLAVLLPIACIPLFIYLFRGIENQEITDRVQLNHKVLLMRALASASIILLVTGTAKLVGPTWAGLLSAFPTTVFPLILIVHASYGTTAVHTIIKHIPQGIGALISYSLCISIVYPLYGIYWGTLMSFAAATVYLLLYMQLKKMFSGSKAH